jgi:hypothetical protein
MWHWVLLGSAVCTSITVGSVSLAFLVRSTALLLDRAADCRSLVSISTWLYALLRRVTNTGEFEVGFLSLFDVV